MCNPASYAQISCPVHCVVHAYKLCVILLPIVFNGENYTFYIPYLVETIIATIIHIAWGTSDSHSGRHWDNRTGSKKCRKVECAKGGLPIYRPSSKIGHLLKKVIF